MDFDKKLKSELLEGIMQGLKEKIKEASENEELSEEEKIKIAYQEMVDPYGFLGSSVKDSATIELLKEKVKKEVDSRYNQRINCGGYALKLDTCVFGGYYKDKSAKENLERNVSKILELFPFVRLLGDTELREDEYIVEYRANGDGGHHFIRIEPNGDISDKNEAKSPRILNSMFENEEEVWGRLKDCPHAIFAVKSEHDMKFTDSYKTYNLSGGLDFEETVLKIIECGSSEFEYHNRRYVIVTNSNGDKIIYSDGEVAAEIIADDSGTIVVESEGKHDYISNTKSEAYDRYLRQIASKETGEQQGQLESRDTEEDFELEL